MSPDGAEVAYLSDNGGHGNLWIARMDGSSVCQTTFERDAATALGVPTDLARAKRSAHVWLMNLARGETRQLTDGDSSESSPTISPDGKLVGFIRTHDDESHLYLLPLDGGEARQLTHVSTGVSDPACREFTWPRAAHTGTGDGTFEQAMRDSSARDAHQVRATAREQGDPVVRLTG